MQPHSRRTFLALGLLATTGGALVGCTGSPDDEDRRGDRRRPDPDEPIRHRAVAATDTLLAGYDALLAAPAGAGLAARLRPLRAEVVQHRAALAEGLPESAAPAGAPPSAGGSGSGSATAAGATATGSAAAAPATSAAALAALERQTAQARLTDLATASPQLARLLASVSAADVLHAVALGDGTPLNVPVPAPVPTATAPAGGSASPGASGTSAAAPSGPPAASATGPGTEAVTALQNALAAEHAAVYGYGVVGARLPDDQQRADARTAHAAHLARRDAWQRLLTGAGATPGAAAAGYQLPFAVTDAAGAGRLAAHIETRLTAVYADLVAALTGPQRSAAADALRESALRAGRWGAEPVPFPGLPAPAAGAATTPAAAPSTATAPTTGP